jgi:hypothetical protein
MGFPAGPANAARRAPMSSAASEGIRLQGADGIDQQEVAIAQIAQPGIKPITW